MYGTGIKITGMDV